MADNAARSFGWRWWLPRLALLAVYIGTCAYLALRNGTGA